MRRDGNTPLSVAAVSMSFAGCASLRNRHHGPSIMGFEDDVEQSFRSKRTFGRILVGVAAGRHRPAKQWSNKYTKADADGIDDEVDEPRVTARYKHLYDLYRAGKSEQCDRKHGELGISKTKCRSSQNKYSEMLDVVRHRCNRTILGRHY
jgi:hypothetical protein